MITNWIISCNPNDYDVEAAFRDLVQIDWGQSMKNIDTGDIVYIYVGQPYQKIMFQCVVVKTDMPCWEIDDHKYILREFSSSSDKYMRLHLVKKLDKCNLDLNTLKDHGLRGIIRGPRRVFGYLLNYIEKTIDEN